jgi:molybdopterin converting factor small subunit
MLQSVQVRYYAQLREALKMSSEIVSLELPISERDLLSILANRHPKQKELLFASRVAVDEGYVPGEKTFTGFSEVDIISPVSGG